MFIGFSSEAKDIALAIQRRLESVADATLWNQGVLGLGKGNLRAPVRGHQKSISPYWYSLQTTCS